MKTKCKHENKKGRIKPYTHCCAGEACDPSSHGCICYVQRCEVCGAELVTNQNQNHSETSGWFMPESEEPNP